MTLSKLLMKFLVILTNCADKMEYKKLKPLEKHLWHALEFRNAKSLSLINYQLFLLQKGFFILFLNVRVILLAKQMIKY